jgi:copper transport protein
MWRLGLLAVLVGTWATLLVGLAPPASAHASLLFTSPGVGTSVPDSPRVLTLIFDQPVALGRDAVRLAASDDGAPTPLGPAGLDRTGRVLTAEVTRPLARRAYTVLWQITARDGDLITGTYQFAVGPVVPGALSSGGSGETGTRGALPTTVLRVLMLLALTVALGEVVGERLARGRAPAGRASPRRLALPADALGAVAAAGLLALVLGDGGLTAALSHPRAGAWSGRAATLALFEIAGFAVAASLGRRGGLLPAAPLVLVIGAEAVRAHPQTLLAGWGAATTVLHLTAATAWFGALLYVARATIVWRATPAAAWSLLAAYARLAVVLFALVVATGTVATVIVAPPTRILGTRYGALLLAKLLVVAGVAGFALAGRSRLRARQRDGAAGPLPAVLLRGEIVLLVGVLALTATLTITAPPAEGSAALPVAPPASGPVVPVGTRAGTIGVGAQASAGQLVLRLTAPGADAAGADAGYRAAANLAAPTGATRRLGLRRCGIGCFVAAVSWQSGVNRVSLRVDSRDWPGGSASIEIPWPPRDGTATLRRVAGVLRRTPTLTIYERVTSDTTTGPGILHRLPVSGAYFLNAEPYSGARATWTTVVTRPEGTTLLLLGFPAEDVTVALDVDEADRIVRETLTAPNHLVTRSFVYPEPDEG